MKSQIHFYSEEVYIIPSHRSAHLKIHGKENRKLNHHFSERINFIKNKAQEDFSVAFPNPLYLQERKVAAESLVYTFLAICTDVYHTNSYHQYNTRIV